MSEQASEQPDLFSPPARELARSSDPDTSHAAARALGGRAGTMRRRLLAEFARWSPRGMTAEEAACAAGFHAGDGAWKRVSDLLNAGLLSDSGKRRQAESRRLQRVLLITDLGREALQAGGTA